MRVLTNNLLKLLYAVFMLQDVYLVAMQPPTAFTICYKPKNVHKQPESFTIPMTLATQCPLFQLKMATTVGNYNDRYSWKETNYDQFNDLKNYFRFVHPDLKTTLGDFSSDGKFKNTLKSAHATHTFIHCQPYL